MKPSSLAVSAFVASAALLNPQYADAFVPSNLMSIHRPALANNGVVAVQVEQRGLSSKLNLSSFLGMDDDDEDEDEEEDDEDDEYMDAPSRDIESPFTGLKLDPYDPKPLLKPRPSEYFPEEYMEEEPVQLSTDVDLVQPMNAEERTENLEAMRQIQKNDLQDLQMRRDHAGYLEASADLKSRIEKDPWFDINERLKAAIQMGKPESDIEYLKNLADRLDGPPGDVTVGWRGYAEHMDIYQYETSAAAQAIRLEYEMRKERAARGKAMMAERKRNEEKEKEQFEEDMRVPGLRREREAKGRREAMLRRVMGEIEEDRKKLQDRAKDMLGKMPETDAKENMKDSLEMARQDVLKERKKNEGLTTADGSTDAATVDGEETTDEADDDALTVAGRKKGSSADEAREAAAAEASGGRPRLPGDKDVTRGELGDMPLESSSTADTGPLTVEVSSVYNKEQSDPPMRKHCFQYTIRITNNSKSDTIQLLGRRFEIQTVGSSMKDVVQGEGVTGRQPILKPGETFEYTSTAPLSVRPIGTTIIAARMHGEYKYVTLKAGQDTATEEQVEAGGDSSAELGMFHFIFPEDQRVLPFKRTEDEDDEDEDDVDEDDEDAAPSAAKSASPSKPAAAAKPVSNPASSLPGDEDLKSGDITVKLNDASDTVTESVRVQVTSSYRPERSDSKLDKHCFAYNIRITNESDKSIQLVSRRFEIQTIGSANKDVVQGPGVTGRQPILKKGESFEYTSTAPLSVKPMMDKSPVVARMQGEYNFVTLGDDGSTPLSSTPLQAKLGVFHFILPALEGV